MVKEKKVVKEKRGAKGDRRAKEKRKLNEKRKVKNREMKSFIGTQVRMKQTRSLSPRILNRSLTMK